MSGAPSKRYRVKYRSYCLYVTIVKSKSEIFISSVEQDTDPLTGGVFDSLTRMVSMAWRTNTLEEVIQQLEKASRDPKDLPGIISRLLTATEEIKN